MTFFLNGKPVDALALIVHRSAQDVVGRQWVSKLREPFYIHSLHYSIFSYSLSLTDRVIPRQMFEVPIQAVIGKKVIARETLKAMRADVTAGLYGGKGLIYLHLIFSLLLKLLGTGHYERKMKHLENQKEGKRRMKRMGTVDLPQEAFFDILSNKK